MATFIIMVGLLGVAALLPVGRFEILEAAKQDRAAACGRAELRDAAVRGLIDPQRWLAYYDNATPYPNWHQSQPYVAPLAPVARNEPQLQHYQAYAIDPLYIARYLTETPSGNWDVANHVARFPHNPSGGPIAPVFMARCSAVTDYPALQSLLGLIGQPSYPTWVMQYAGSVPRFDRMFTWQDDQLFDNPPDPQQRPIRQFDTAGAGQFDGNYSWMMTVAPAVNEAGLPVENRRLYEVSVVVFYQRDFSSPWQYLDPDRPPERIVPVTFIGGGWAGGDVQLTAPAGSPPGMLDLRENQWILIGANQPIAPGPNPTYRKVFKWYRVVAVEEENPNTPLSRLVTLAGPDWQVDTNLDGAFNTGPNGPDPAYAILCTGVVGVYSRVVQLD